MTGILEVRASDFRMRQAWMPFISGISMSRTRHPTVGSGAWLSKNSFALPNMRVEKPQLAKSLFSPRCT